MYAIEEQAREGGQMPAAPSHDTCVHAAPDPRGRPPAEGAELESGVALLLSHCRQISSTYPNTVQPA